LELARLRAGRDGWLIVVNDALTRYLAAGGIAPTLQDALDDRARLAPRLQDLYFALDVQQSKEAQEPLVYQGGADDFLRPAEDAQFRSEHGGVDLAAEIGVIVGDMPMGSTADEVRRRGDIRLVLLLNDWSLRNLVPTELARGFGFCASKPAIAFVPVAVTPDELGDAWDAGSPIARRSRRIMRVRPVEAAAPGSRA
jgi:fumarylacetoacetate (FAA) hydrolase